MPFVDIGAALRGELNTAVDARHERDHVPQADAALYRLGFRSAPFPLVPFETRIDDVEVHLTKGPVVTQSTELRQRHAVELVWDKVLARDVEVGAGEHMTICQVRLEHGVSDFSSAIENARSASLAALGKLCVIFDERLVDEELLEDLILFQDGAPVACVDMASLVRAYLPYEPSGVEVEALQRLAERPREESDRADRAARLMLRATREGPTQEAFLTLWIAVETLCDSLTPSRKEIEGLLEDSELPPEAIDEDHHVGRLIGLRGDLVHGVRVAPDVVKDAYYRLEGVARALLRREIGARSSWPAAPAMSLFDEASARALSEARKEPRTEWHRSMPEAQADLLGLRWFELRDLH